MDKRQASSFYPHFAIEERPTIDQFVGLFNRLLFTGQAFLTDFLDPRQRQIMGKRPIARYLSTSVQ